MSDEKRPLKETAVNMFTNGRCTTVENEELLMLVLFDEVTFSF
jgi:hypothetical protein